MLLNRRDILKLTNKSAFLTLSLLPSNLLSQLLFKNNFSVQVTDISSLPKSIISPDTFLDKLNELAAQYNQSNHYSFLTLARNNELITFEKIIQINPHTLRLIRFWDSYDSYVKWGKSKERLALQSILNSKTEFQISKDLII